MRRRLSTPKSKNPGRDLRRNGKGWRGGLMRLPKRLSNHKPKSGCRSYYEGRQIEPVPANAGSGVVPAGCAAWDKDTVKTTQPCSSATSM